MTTATSTPTDDPAGTRTVQVHRVYITAPAQRVWDALLSPEWTDRYGYGGFVQSDLRAGSPYVTTAGSGMQEYGIAGPIIDGEVIESDPPRQFVQTWRMLMDDGLKAEGFTRLTYELVETGGSPGCGHARPHRRRTSGPDQRRCRRPAGRRRWRLALVPSDLKSLLETGTASHARADATRGRLGTWIVPDRLRRVVAADVGGLSPRVKGASSLYSP
jgi:uncharacterized protein YndB with AHSA1/START domain